uniref:hypothetical protein n=1 Tax=uncultured Bilophila sp. TaxID=529385 RepID=UPI0025F00841|nr:hypothetical protein [uncultured Bilophila sp.]
MMLSLHAVVRGAVTAVHPDERVVRYRSVGQSNVRGKMVPAYADPETLDAQIQSEKDDALYHAGRADENSIMRRRRTSPTNAACSRRTPFSHKMTAFRGTSPSLASRWPVPWPCRVCAKRLPMFPASFP